MRRPRTTEVVRGGALHRNAGAPATRACAGGSKRPSPRSRARSERRGYTSLTSPREAGQGTTRSPCSTARNPRWPAPVRNAEAAVGGACEGRSPRRRAGRRNLNLKGATPGYICFPPNGFAFSLTLFSKCFSPFPHGTCLLSVSCLIFSFRWSLPPTLGCIPKQPDSPKTPNISTGDRPRTGFSPSLTRHSRSTLVDRPSSASASLGYNSPAVRRRFKARAIPASLAVTGGIPVGFFSSAY